MPEDAIRAVILKELYAAKFNGTGRRRLRDLQDENSWDERSFESARHRLEDEGLFEYVLMGGIAAITARGVVVAEQEGIADADIKRQNERLRTSVLEFLADVYEERGQYARTHYEKLARTLKVDQALLIENLGILGELGYTESGSIGEYSISLFGKDEVAKVRDKQRALDEFDEIEAKEPRARGRAFQTYLAGVLESEGWKVKEGARTSHEEMDVLLSRNREILLAECKWTSERVEASVIRELMGKLENRAGVSGLLFSMSGFSTGAVEQCQDYANKRPILLFGPSDTRSVIARGGSFDQLLDAKHNELVTRQVASWA